MGEAQKSLMQNLVNCDKVGCHGGNMGDKTTVPVLETERLILRPLALSDMEAVFKWAGDERVNRFMIYPLYKSAEDGREWLGSLYSDEDKKDFGFVLKENGELIGSGGIYYHDDWHGHSDVWSVGYNLRYDHQGRGFATEAMERIVGWARETLGVRAIAGIFAVENTASRRVMEKLGMTFYETTEYTKLDGSATFRAETWRRRF